MSKVSRKYNNRNLRRKYSVKKQHRFQRSKKGGAVAMPVPLFKQTLETTTVPDLKTFKKTEITINDYYIILNIINKSFFGVGTPTVVNINIRVNINSVIDIKHPLSGTPIKHGLEIKYTTAPGNPDQIINIWSVDPAMINDLSNTIKKIRYPDSN
jgi:hypothetical protein